MTTTLAMLNDGTSRARYFVAKVGSSCAGRTGLFAHIAWSMDFDRGDGTTWTNYSSGCRSGSRTMPTVSELPGYDTDRVTCPKCTAWLERVTAARAAKR